ncbi:MAG TPA: hypothetical protein VNZ45_03020 [Bacteroidia bacterium]|jgi:hypothetical protein|nr:hypothetical protein [Bacteroidia bacterium]
MRWEPTASHAPLNNGGDLPHHLDTRQAMGVPHPYPNSGDHDALDTVQPVNSAPADNGYTPLSSPKYSYLEDTGTSKTS